MSEMEKEGEQLIAVKCDNCGEAKTYEAGQAFPAHMIHYDYSSDDQVSMRYRREPQLRVAAYTCDDCKSYAERAAEEARKQALAIRAIKGPMR